MSTKLDDFNDYKINIEINEAEDIYTQVGTGEVAAKRWSRKKLLGRGAFGMVWLHKDERNGTRAVKQISKNQIKMNQRELYALIMLKKHPQYFVEFFGWFESETFIYLAMEYMGCGDLGDFILEKPPTENEARLVTRQLLEGIKILHENKFCHRDLKPQNILIVQWVPILVKISDFGISKHFGDQTFLQTMAGTPGYAAPEALDIPDVDTSVYTTAVDIWSLGCITHAMLTQEVPFPGSKGLRHYITTYIDAETSFPKQKLIERKASTATIKFISALIIPEPKHRLTAEEALRDPWLAVRENEDETVWEESFKGLNLRGSTPNPVVPDKATPKTHPDTDTTPSQNNNFNTPTMLSATTPPREDTNGAVHSCITAYCAIKHGNLNTLKRLCQENQLNLKNVNARQAGNTTLLHMSLNAGDKSEEMMKLLLEKGASVTAQDQNQRTALTLAALKKREGLVKILLQNGADVNLKDTQGWSQLHRAAKKDHEAVVKILLDMGADITATAAAEGTALHIAARAGSEKVIKLLLQHGADITAKKKKDWTALHTAAFHGHIGVAKVLLEDNADITAKTKYSEIPLHHAAQEGHDDLVKLLLEYGSDPNARNSTGVTPLYRAVTNGSTGIVRLLLESGADTEAKAGEDWTALHAAAFYGEKGAAKALLQNKANITAKTKLGEIPLHHAAQKGHDDLIKLLIEYGSDPNARNNEGLTPLYRAAKNGWVGAIRVLLANRAGIKAKNEDGLTVLHTAASKGHIDAVELLLENKADVTATTKAGDTPLHHAVENGSNDVVKLLLEYGSEINAMNKRGLTPIYRAAEYRKTEVARLLIENGADITIATSEGVTPLEEAAGGENKVLVELFKSHVETIG